MPLVVLSEKVQEDVLALWKKTKEESEAQTGNQFVELILEKYLNPKVKIVETVKRTPEDEAEILQLNNEIARLKTLINFKDETIESHEETLKLLGEKVAAMVADVPNIPTVPDLTENQEIITFTDPLIIHLLDTERAFAAKQAKKEISRTKHLIDTFFMGINDGKSYPYKVWSDNELRRLRKQFTLPATNE